MVIRWIPTNSSALMGVLSTSRQSSIANAQHDLVQRLRLRAATVQLGNRRHVAALGITFDYNVELAVHMIILRRWAGLSGIAFSLFLLREEFLQPIGLSIHALVRALRVPPRQVSGIVNEKRGVRALMAWRLARYFGSSAELWLGLQQDYELDVARDEAGERIAIEVLPRAS
jgi:addiction module HigA family antidote